MNRFKNYSIIVLVMLCFISTCSWFGMKKKLKECEDSITTDTLYIDTTSHHQADTLPVAISEQKKETVKQIIKRKYPNLIKVDHIDSINTNKFQQQVIDSYLYDSLYNAITDSLLNVLNIYREYYNEFGDSLVKIEIYSKTTGILDDISCDWKLTIPPVISKNRKEDQKQKNKYYGGIGVGTDTTLNVSLLMLNKKKSAYRIATNTLGYFNNGKFNLTVDYYYRF